MVMPHTHTRQQQLHLQQPRERRTPKNACSLPRPKHHLTCTIVLVGLHSAALTTVLFSYSSSTSSIAATTKTRLNKESVKLAPWKPVTYPKGSCQIKVVGGNPNANNYGSWPVCTNLLPDSPLVYSFGIGGDVSFDVSMVKDYGAKSVFCYDPTIDKDKFTKIVANSNCTDHLHFSQIGVGESNGTIQFFKSKSPKIGSLVSTPGLEGYETTPIMTAPVLDLTSLVAINKHEWVDLIKMDVEGAEFDIFSNRLDYERLPSSQILIEFHARLFPNGFDQQEKIYQNFFAAGFELAYEQPKRKEEVVFIRVKSMSE